VLNELTPPLTLIIDDDDAVRTILRDILEEGGCRVIEAVDGLRGIEAYEQSSPDLVLVDVTMPVMDGLAVCAAIRPAAERRHVPIIVVTGRDDEATISRAFEAGAYDYITKPLELPLVLRRLQSLLRSVQVDQATCRARRQWEATFDAVGDAILLTDREGRIVRSNRAATEWLHSSDADLLGRRLTELFFGDQAATEAALEAFATEVVETSFPALPGMFRVNNYPVQLDDHATGAVHVVRDMTAQYEAERAVRKAEAWMVNAQKLADLGTLAAGVAHELNSPLQVVIGLSESMLRRSRDGTLETGYLERNLDIIHRNGWRCAEIVRSLHTYARASGGQMALADLNALVKDALLLVEHQLRSWSNVAIGTVLAEQLPPLFCDRNQVIQVLINLLTNARDAMPDGGEITIHTEFEPVAGEIVLSVSDTGTGIAESIRRKIFDPFFTTKPVGKGTGLGLSIVAGIVRAYGGEISVVSKPREGTTFGIRLPVARPDGSEVAAPSSGQGRFDDVGQRTMTAGLEPARI
jgi:signal transduction histidine kinase